LKKVLIVSYYFPPINVVAARRYGSMCKYFAKYGYEPYVLTTSFGRNPGLDARLDLELPLDKSRVIRIGNSKNNSEIGSVLGNFVMNVLDSGKIMSRTLAWEVIGWYEKVKRDLDLERIRDIDIIVATYPAMGNLYVAKYLSKKLGCPYIADIRDLISDYTETTEGYRNCKWLDIVIEKYILNAAGGIVTVTPGFRDILRKRYPGKRYKVVFNGWDDVKTVQATPKEADKYLYYAGSLYLHRLESFELLVKCLKKINDEGNDKYKFLVRSIGPKELDVKAANFVKREGMQEYVNILPSVPGDIVQQEQKGACINIVLSTVHEEDVALMTTIPGKVYELLNEDASILAIVPKGSDVEKVLQYTQKGITSISEDEIIDFIGQKNKMCKGNGNIAYFTRERQAERLCRFMNKVLENT
jgi:glycosyltransferase involved in cell wall biosynthesis